MKTAIQVAWPCGYRFSVRRSGWFRDSLPEPLTRCPLHHRYCPVPVDQPLRQSLKALWVEMYELDSEVLLDRLEGIIMEALVPWQVPDEPGGA